MENYKELCQLNYCCKFAPVQSEKSSSLNEYGISQGIADDITAINEALCAVNDDQPTEDKLHLGVISSGTHSIDYKRYYKACEVGDWGDFENWNDTPVMFVYECPADNLPSSFWAKKNGYEYTKNKKDRKSLNYNQHENKDLLCKDLWHLDEIDKDEEKEKWQESITPEGFDFFSDKTYGKFILSLILSFKLNNLYTTNFFRYEIFKIDHTGDKNKEIALNLPVIRKEVFNDKDYIPKVFKEEIGLFKPEIILATSNPYYCIKRNIEELKEELKLDTEPLLIKVPHPANRDSKETRFLKNFMSTFYALKKAGVKKEKLSELFEKAYDKYEAIIENS